jgi:predicted RecA/RadA family phage recombinase
MAKNKRVQEGDVINIYPGADVVGGDVLAFGSRGGVVTTDAAAGDLTGLQIEGVFQFTGREANAFALGDVCYYENGEVTTTSGGILVGKATTEKAAGVVGTVNVKLEGA